MSAFISAQTSDSVVILTDGAVYDPNKRLMRVERKIQVSSRQPVAIATRGEMELAAMAANRIIEWVERWGFDEAMRVLEAIVGEFAPRGGPKDAIEVLVAGISEAHGPRHLTFQTVPNYGEPALQLRHPGQVCAAVPGQGGLSEIGIRRPRSGETAEDYFAENGLKMMQHYREQALRPGLVNSIVEGKIYVVGGQLDMTVVTTAGVSVRTLHRWENDKVGELIDPFADVRKCSTLGMERSSRSTMNRQQRRAKLRPPARACLNC